MALGEPVNRWRYPMLPGGFAGEASPGRLRRRASQEGLRQEGLRQAGIKLKQASLSGLAKPFLAKPFLAKPFLAKPFLAKPCMAEPVQIPSPALRATSPLGEVFEDSTKSHLRHSLLKPARSRPLIQ